MIEREKIHSIADLKIGDRVGHVSDPYNRIYVITDISGGRATGVRTVDIEDPHVWLLLVQKDK